MSRDAGDTSAAEALEPPAADPVAWLLAERLAGRDHSGVAVGRAYGRTGDAGARWGQRIVRTANDRRQTPPSRIHAVK